MFCHLCFWNQILNISYITKYIKSKKQVSPITNLKCNYCTGWFPSRCRRAIHLLILHYIIIFKKYSTKHFPCSKNSVDTSNTKGCLTSKAQGSPTHHLFFPHIIGSSSLEEALWTALHSWRRSCWTPANSELKISFWQPGLAGYEPPCPWARAQCYSCWNQW